MNGLCVHVKFELRVEHDFNILAVYNASFWFVTIFPKINDEFLLVFDMLRKLSSHHLTKAGRAQP